MLKNLANLIKVKTIVTLVVISVFAALSLRGDITPTEVLMVTTSVIAFYFGTAHERTAGTTGGEGPEGPAGPQGPQGPQGSQGSQETPDDRLQYLRSLVRPGGYAPDPVGPPGAPGILIPQEGAKDEDN